MNNLINSTNLLNISDKPLEELEEKIPNRGTGAGGKKTNKNGLKYEFEVSIKNLLGLEQTKVRMKMDGSIMKGTNDVYYTLELNNKYKVMSKKGLSHYFYKILNEEIGMVLEPDECFVDEINKKIFIIEVKNQNTSGSVDEKIRCCGVTKDFYKVQYPGYNIEYIYVLSNFFKENKYKYTIKYIKDNFNVNTLFGSDTNYLSNMIDILNA
jgi:hypothetical protein